MMDNNINSNNDNIKVEDYNGNPYIKKCKLFEGLNTFLLLPYLPVSSVEGPFFSNNESDFYYLPDNTCSTMRNIINPDFVGHYALSGSEKIKYERYRDEILSLFSMRDFLNFLNCELIENKGKECKDDLLKYIIDSFKSILKKNNGNSSCSLVRLTFVGKDDDKVINCGFGKHKENLITQVYKLAGRKIPNCFVDKVYDSTTSKSYKNGFSKCDVREKKYLELLSLIPRERKKSFKSKIVKMFSKACILPFEREDFSFIDKIDFVKGDFFEKSATIQKDNLAYVKVKYLSLIETVTLNGIEAQKLPCGAVKITRKFLDNVWFLNAILENFGGKGSIIKRVNQESLNADKLIAYISEFGLKMKKTFQFEKEDERKGAVKQLLSSLKDFLTLKFNCEFYGTDIPIEVCDESCDYTAIYFYQSIFYAVMLKCLDKSKENINKILENMENIRSSFESDSVGENWLVDDRYESLFDSFIAKIIGQGDGKQIDQNTLSDIKKSALTLYKIICEATTSTELVIIRSSKDLTKTLLVPDALISKNELLFLIPSLAKYEKYDCFDYNKHIVRFFEFCLVEQILKKQRDEIKNKILASGYEESLKNDISATIEEGIKEFAQKRLIFK